MDNKVFLSGCGIINKAGNSLESIKNNSDALGEISEFKLEDFISSQKSYLDRSGELSLAAAQTALNMTKYSITDDVNWDFGVSTGSLYGATPTLERYTKSIVERSAKGANSILFTHLYMNSPVSILSIDFRLGGHHLCFGGKNGAVTAISQAYNAVKTNRAKDMLVVCYDVIPKNYGIFSDISEGATAFIFSKESTNSLALIPEQATNNIEDENISFKTANRFLLSFL